MWMRAITFLGWQNWAETLRKNTPDAVRRGKNSARVGEKPTLLKTRDYQNYLILSSNT